MLFNSYEFVFAFFPVTVLGYYLVARLSQRLAIAFILAASLFFYAWWDASFLALLLGSILFNYCAGVAIDRAAARGCAGVAKTILVSAIACDLIALGIFKYAHFAISSADRLLGTTTDIGHILLPLGISFFTFEQIAYLVDVRNRRTAAGNLLDYALFVAFFPRLVAGPILRYTEIIPQLSKGLRTAPYDDIGIGLTIFIFGLFKKVVLADGIAIYANPVFATAAAGEQLDFFAAWGGVLAYTLQLYFDFSGYSDMAIGAARCFGIRFPLNFFSPYKATSIIEFWRRWHITLSRFLRDYLYIALGGNRRGVSRRYVNLMLTMLLGGLWHGANWTFVFWGGLHGAYLVINHGWIALRRASPRLDALHRRRAVIVLCWCLTFLAVVVAWVFFRATSFDAALALLQGMSGLNGFAVPYGLGAALGPAQGWLSGLGVVFYEASGSVFVKTYLWIGALMVIALTMPNVYEIMAKYGPALDSAAATGSLPVRFARLRWHPSRAWAAAVAALALVAIVSLTRVSEFLYWQF